MDLTAELTRAMQDDALPDHRWYDAQRAVSENERPSQIDDPMVKRAVTFLRSFRDNRAARKALSDLRKVDAPIFDAFRCFSSPMDRARMESLLLCGDLPLNSVATQMSMADRVVQVYMSLFFDIEDFREDTARLWRLVRNRSIFTPESGWGSDYYMWPRLALQYGFHVLDFYINPRAVSPSDQKLLDAVINSEAQLNMLRVVKDAPINSYTAEGIRGAYDSHKEREFRKEQAELMGPRASPLAEIFGPVLLDLNARIRVLNPTEPVPAELTMNLGDRFALPVPTTEPQLMETPDVR